MNVNIGIPGCDVVYLGNRYQCLGEARCLHLEDQTKWNTITFKMAALRSQGGKFAV
jgi:hypothetical protein